MSQVVELKYNDSHNQNLDEYLFKIIISDEQQAQNNSMEQDIETNREGSAAPLAGNVSVEHHADDSDDSL